MFPNGSSSSEFRAHLNELESKISEIVEVINILNSSHEEIESLKLEFIINKIAVMRPYLSQANSFITCHLAQNSNDQKAVKLRGEIISINARVDCAIKLFQRLLADIDSQAWEMLIEKEALVSYKFILNDWREKAVTLLSEEEERLVSDLMIDGYHAWGQFYHSL